MSDDRLAEELVSHVKLVGDQAVKIKRLEFLLCDIRDGGYLHPEDEAADANIFERIVAEIGPLPSIK